MVPVELAKNHHLWSTSSGLDMGLIVKGCERAAIFVGVLFQFYGVLIFANVLECRSLNWPGFCNILEFGFWDCNIFAEIRHFRSFYIVFVVGPRPLRRRSLELPRDHTSTMMVFIDLVMLLVGISTVFLGFTDPSTAFYRLVVRFSP